MAAGKRAGMSKPTLDAAIARGQGVTVTADGTTAALEPLTVEAMLPGGVAAVIDCLTDNRARTLQDLRTAIVKDGGGSVGATAFLFERQGRAVFEVGGAAAGGGGKEGQQQGQGTHNADVDLEAVYLDPAVDAGAADLILDSSSSTNQTQTHTLTLVASPPETTAAVAARFAAATGLPLLRTELVWEPRRENVVERVADAETARVLEAVVAAVRQEGSVQEVYLNLRGGVGGG